MAKYNLIDLQGKSKADGSQEQGPLFLLTNFCQNVKAKGRSMGGEDIEISPSDAVNIIEVLMYGLSDIARDIKRKDKPAAISVESLKGDNIMALKVAYEPGTKDNPEGAWEPMYVFGNEGIEGCIIGKINEPKFHGRFIERAQAYGFHFTNPGLIFATVLSWAESLYTWLDQNAAEGDEVAVEHPDFFTAKVNVIDGKKVFSLVMSEELSNIIKSDDQLQVNPADNKK